MREIDSIKKFGRWLSAKKRKAIAVQGLDLGSFEKKILQLKFKDCLFLGCKLSEKAAGHIVATGGLYIPQSNKVAFAVHRSKLYSPNELFAGFDPKDEKAYFKTHDYIVYKEYLKQGKDSPKSIYTSLMRRLHDHSITDALDEAIEGRKVVAIMGGHSMERQAIFYQKIACLARILTQKGFLMVSGGGPGAMEATHLGAYFAAREEEELLQAIEEIKIRPKGAIEGKEYLDKDWLHRAFRVMQKYPIPRGKTKQCMSIGIPTWLYGHEPPAPFATHIAKYFANSVREDGLLAIAKHGVIFAPGSAGTTQEIFQDATQNHYGSMGVISPMILFGEEHWTQKRPVWPLLQKVAKGKMYGELLALTDSEDEIIRRILMFDEGLYKV